jgi:hypothetical protein
MSSSKIETDLKVWKYPKRALAPEAVRGFGVDRDNEN